MIMKYATPEVPWKDRKHFDAFFLKMKETEVQYNQ